MAKIFPRDSSWTFQLIRNTSKRSKVFAQRKCTVGTGEVELLNSLAVFYQNKHNLRDFFRSSTTPFGLWKFSAIVCLGHRLTEASFKTLLVSNYDPVRLSIFRQSLKDMKGIPIKFVVITNPRGISNSFEDCFRMKMSKTNPNGDTSKCFHLWWYSKGNLPW